MMDRAWSSIVKVPYCFSRSYVNFQGHTALPKLGVSGLELQFEFTNGYWMLHKAWNSKGEMPYSFPRSSIKFQGHTVQNITDFDPNWAFPDYRPLAAFKSLRFALLLHYLVLICWTGVCPWQGFVVIVVSKGCHFESLCCLVNNDSLHKGPVMWKLFPCHDIIMVWREEVTW